MGWDDFCVMILSPGWREPLKDEVTTSLSPFTGIGLPCWAIRPLNLKIVNNFLKATFCATCIGSDFILGFFQRISRDEEGPQNIRNGKDRDASLVPLFVSKV